MQPREREKQRVWKATKGICPHCRQQMTARHTDGTAARRRMSRDHILPRQWGGGRLGELAVNTRWVCQECNNHRASCGHCVGAMACVEQVATETCAPFGKILRKWKMGQVAAMIVVPWNRVLNRKNRQ